MPKAKRSEEEIIDAREHILEEALNIIIQKGFDKFPMRKLAKRLDMTAANLYNYFRNKEELYLHLDLIGYRKLHEMLLGAVDKQKNILEKLRALFQAYIEFGLKFPHQYDMMFNRFTPSSIDYRGTETEQFAKNQVGEAIKNWSLAHHFLSLFIQNNPKLKGKDSKILALRIWCELHGVISLYNSNILQDLELSEIDGINRDPRQMIDEILDQILGSLQNGSI